MLRSPLVITLGPGQDMTLSGKIGTIHQPSASIKVLDRPPELLPKGLSSHVNITDNVVTVSLRNNGKHDLLLDNRTVFAELHSMSQESSTLELEALVGPSLDTEATIEGSKVSCLIDSGSQVSIVSETFYRSKLSHVTLEELSSELKVVGAGGNVVPYLGFVRVNVSMSKDVVGVGEGVNALMLVCPDTDFSQRVPVIIGTNVLRNLAGLCRDVFGSHFVSLMQVCPAVAFMYQDVTSENDGKVGSARVRNAQVLVPPGETVEVKCNTHANVPNTRNSVLVQEPTGTSLPDGLKVVGCRVSADCLANIKVVVINESDGPLLIKKNQVIADIFIYHHEYDVNQVVSQLSPQSPDSDTHVFSGSAQVNSEKPENSNIHFKFGEAEQTNPEWCKQFEQKLQSFKGAFVTSEFDIGRAETGDLFDMDVTPGPDIRERARPIPPRDFEECRQHIKGLLDAKIIRPSNSPFASPIVLVRKKNGALRMCIDYRRLNARTVKDSYSIPKIEDLLLTLNGAKFFTTLDLCKAYYQVPMTDRASKYSAFITPFGLYEWDRLSQGLANAPACFQRLMETVFSDMNLTQLIIFLDDILIHAKTLEELEERTIQVLQRLCKYNLRLDPEKCIFGATQVKHLGYVISEGTIRPDPDKIATVKDWPRPKTVKDVKSFIGFAGFYRRFIPNFSSLARPLNDLTVGYAPGSRSKSGKKQGQITLSSPVTSAWGDAQEKSFNSLISALTSDLVLGLADRSKPFTLHCDASGVGLGAVLYQEFDGKSKVIAYASRGLNKSEQNYPAHKREFLALKWAMCDKFRDYLLGTKVTVVTDNNPLCYILKNAKLDATSHRWLSSLSMFDFDLKYKKGLTHTDADALSRLPQDSPTVDEEYEKTLEDIAFLTEKARSFDTGQAELSSIASDSVQAILQSHYVHSSNASGSSERHTLDKTDNENRNNCSDSVISAVEQLMVDPNLIPDDILDPKVNPDSLNTVTDWRKMQLADRHLSYVIRCLEKGKTMESSELDSLELKAYAREQKKLLLKQGVLYRKVEVDDEVSHFQLVLPRPFRGTALKGVHEDLFHTHFEDAIAQLRMRFFWPHMSKDLEQKIKGCHRCIRKGARCQKAPMNSIVTTFPLELLSIDFLTIEINGQKQNILVMMDHFTKFGHAVCTKDQTARTVARTLWKEFFLTYGFPKTILSDQGRDFESKLVKELCAIAGVQKCRTTPYHPSGNPVERWNRTLLGMLRSIEDTQKIDLKKTLPEVVHAYNCCIHQSTGHSPYLLFFGRHPRIPIDLAFGIDVGQKKQGSPSQYIRDLKQKLTSAYQKASESMAKTNSKNKARYDVSARAAELEVGDRVLVRKLGPRLDSKLSDRWERSVHIVIARRDSLPVYTVQDEAGTGPKRTLHRNYLLPIGMIDPQTPKETGSKPPQNCPKEQPKTVAPKPSVSCVEEDFEGCTIEISPNSPSSQLRADAIEFRPRSVGSHHEPSAQPDEWVEPSQQAEWPVNEGLGGGNSLSPVDPASSVEEDSSSSEESECEEENQVTPIPAPRKSLRVRKPVERLNLAHLVERNQHFDGNLIAKVIDYLEVLTSGTLDSKRCKAVEQVLNVLITL